jgi:hypothetical protein
LGLIKVKILLADKLMTAVVAGHTALVFRIESAAAADRYTTVKVIISTAHPSSKRRQMPLVIPHGIITLFISKYS